MRLLLIRHGETVDNIAGLYAGVRDSALTIHGVEQTRRLGNHLAQHQLRPTHIFASPLQRAYKTAEALQTPPSAHSRDGPASPVPIVTVDELIEQDFGFYEGKPFYARSSSLKSGKEAHRETNKDQPGFVDVESKEAMAKRADVFLDRHLLPLLDRLADDETSVVAIVSHGMLLSSLWKRFLIRLPKKSVTIAPEVTALRGEIVLEHLGGWSNTGYLDLSLRREVSVCDHDGLLARDDEFVAQSEIPSASPSPSLNGWVASILAVDSKLHLQGLKRQRGGIGRMAHDAGQKTIDGFFFKKQRKS